jgi:hypothetical protein
MRAMIREALASQADTAIVPAQDLLGLAKNCVSDKAARTAKPFKIGSTRNGK